MSQQIYCRNGAFSFSNKTPPDEFVSRQIRAIALCNATVHHLTQKNPHSHTRTEDFLFFFPANKKNCHRHVNGFSDIPFISLLRDRAKSFKNIFSIQ